MNFQNLLKGEPIAKLGRLDYVDALRGLAILLVIYMHIVGFGLWEGDGGYREIGWSPAVITLRFRMPLFFFISGLFAWTIYDKITLSKRVKNRLYKQLWPTVVVCLLYSFLFREWQGFERWIFNITNTGYWFTQSLVQVFIAYALIAYLMNRMHLNRMWQTIILAGLLILVYVLSYKVDSSKGWAYYSYAYKSMYHFGYFICGVLARMWFAEFQKIFTSLWIYAIIILAFTFVCITGRFSPAYPIGLAGIISTYGIFYYTKEFWAGESVIANGMRMLGRNTLPIYLYHYFLLHPLRQHHTLAQFKWIYGNLWIEIPAVMGLSIVLALTCVAIDKVLKTYMHPVHRMVYAG